MTSNTMKQLNDLFGNGPTRIGKHDHGIYISVWDQETQNATWCDLVLNHKPDGTCEILIKVNLLKNDLSEKNFLWSADNEPKELEDNGNIN